MVSECTVWQHAELNQAALACGQPQWPATYLRDGKNNHHGKPHTRAGCLRIAHDQRRTVLAFSAHRLMQQLGKNPQAANAHAPCFEIALCTPDVPQALAQAIAAGAQPMRPVEVMPWGQTMAYVADINGFLVELCTPMG